MIESPALDWHRASIAYYQRLIDRYTALGIADRDAGNANPDRQAMRRHEIRRLRSMVAAVNEKVIQLGGN